MRKNLMAAMATIGLLAGGPALAQGGAGQAGTSPDSPAPDSPASTAASSATARPAEQQGASAEAMLGRTVVAADGEEVGEIEDVILDPASGAARQLVVKSGGFLGMGGKTIALDIAEAMLDPAGEQVQLSGMISTQLQDMPEFEYDDSTISLARGNADRAGGATAGGATAPAEKPPTSTTTPGTAGGGQ